MKNLRFTVLAFRLLSFLGLLNAFLELLVSFQNLPNVSAEVFQKLDFALGKKNALFCIGVLAIYKQVHVTDDFLSINRISLKAEIY